MLIARTTDNDGLQAPGLSFGVIGTCRVHNPMRAMIDQGRIEMVWRGFNAFTHGPAEAIQYLRFVRGEAFIPDRFSPFIFRTDVTPDVDQKLIDAMQKLDFLIVEISAFARIHCGAYEFQQNYFSENFIRKGGADFLNWWRDVSQGKPSRDSADDLIQSREDGVAPHDEEILRTLRFDNLDDESFLDRIRTLSRKAGLPLLLVPHFSFDNSDNAIAKMRVRNRNLVQQAANELAHECFDPSELLMAYGREAALKNEGRDLYHYSPEFDAYIGGKMLDHIGETRQLSQASAAAG